MLGGSFYRSEAIKTAELCLKKKDYFIEKEGQVKSKRMDRIFKKEKHLLKIKKGLLFWKNNKICLMRKKY